MTYHLTGWISAAIFLLTIGGLFSQWHFVKGRHEKFARGELGGETPTAVLSLNQFVSSYLAFFSFLIYGATLPRFNHYLVWSRAVACVLTLVLIYQIWRDRRDRYSAAAFAANSALLLSSVVLLLHPGAVRWGQLFSQGLVVTMTLVLAQGYLHQVAIIRQTGRTGAVSIRMHQFFLLKDISTIAFALAMGWSTGWPLLLMSSVSGVLKAITLWQFRWVRRSEVAAERRARGGGEGSGDWSASVVS